MERATLNSLQNQALIGLTVEPFSPTLEDNISITAKGESGKLTFRYVLIPRKAGDFEILAHSIHWFNALSANHEEIVLPELQFHSKDSGVRYGTTNIEVEDILQVQTNKSFAENWRHIILEPSPFHSIADWNWTYWAIGASLCRKSWTFLVLALVRRKSQREHWIFVERERKGAQAIDESNQGSSFMFA